jgi:Myb-like DNA-binding domain
MEETDIVKDDILSSWEGGDNPMEKTALLANRIRGSDLCLILFYKKVKKLMESWDFTCFGIIGPDQDMIRSKRTLERVSIDGCMQRIDGEKRKGKGMRDDPRFIPRDPEENTAHQRGTRKRAAFTRQEDDAIVRGVAEYGEGKWVRIKLARSYALRNRDPVQIKDRYRTLEKKGLIQYSAVIGGQYV